VDVAVTIAKSVELTSRTGGAIKSTLHKSGKGCDEAIHSFDNLYPLTVSYVTQCTFAGP
jgi:hypothetical protein